mmetsp:Transcript_81302/g.161381  ORF Transcript_81302/g.161381 Transcript_81302/m.161381 type:complete len:725 (+) Transcript_81302:68-2242(+)|eukprot:CAMPEP_0172798632 /NCGR_PEP_ID=MMETSP1075-20121228/1285_1 /TAXON_ID=2916 /ORGANISM="Ceratium fusus, Strain PA161109" /LENGTH=724 /DNA_ID=CAMNT_0013636139 /DNA_START=68 /DNA_END=2242 /DNA_ORIENTATION=+
MAGGLKVVGPNVKGKREEYQLVRRLQSALFGGVYEAKGLSSGRDFAIKVLHKSELSKAEETSSIEFCEVPLSEIKFAELMRGDDHVMDIEDHFQDMYCFYVVFDLCRGGDLLEALKQKPNGFDEAHAQFLVQQAAKGLAYLHRRKVAMQDVSLENMLLHVNGNTGHYQVKVCDPGQAVIFEVDENGQELPVKFRGLVGKSFRPPELHEQKSYYSTKVDSWCLGWSTFYLLTAQPLFMSADPAQKDLDWLAFQQDTRATLFKQKSNLCSRLGLDFIFRLLQLEPGRRMSVAEALEHAWLADPKVMPVLAPKELLPESLLKLEERRQQEAEALPPANEEHHLTQQPSYTGCGASSPGGNCSSGSSLPRLHDSGSFNGTIQGISSPSALNSGGGLQQASTSITWANAPSYNGHPHTPMLRVRSPMRAPRGSGVASSPRLAADRDRRRGQPLHPGVAARSPYVIATAHSPPPQISPGSPGLHRAQNRSNGPRTASPCAGTAPHAGLHRMPLGPNEAQPPRPAFLTPRSTSRTKIGGLQSPLNKVESPEGDDRGRERAWAFKSESTMADNASKMEPISFFPHGRQAASPARAAGSAIYMQHQARSASPMQSVEAVGGPGMPHMRPAMRTPSPVTGGVPRAPAAGFSWTQAPATFSPRTGLSASTPLGRTASPVGAAASPIGFAWSPDPPSPRQSPRAYSPQPVGSNLAFGKGGMLVGAVRAAPRRSGPM